MNYKEKLRNLIAFSGLDLNQKNLWSLFLQMSFPEEDEAVFEAVNESEDNLNLLTAHLKDKLRDMKDTNQDTWVRLGDDQKRFAESV